MGKTRRSSWPDRNFLVSCRLVNYSWQKFIMIHFIVELAQIGLLKTNEN